MYDSSTSDIDRPTIFMLHFLGGSAREWTAVSALIGPSRCVAIDLPGFGDAAEVPGYRVADMAAYVTRAIAERAPARWMLAGHSMGAKVAAAIVRAAEDGAKELAGLEGLIVLAGSPPSPEPMDESQRDEMLRWFSGDRSSNRGDAETYIANNSGPALEPAARQAAVDDVLRANRAAWIAWLESGSREDWSARIGVLRTPALILAGAEDENLGPDAQERLMAPHFANVRSVTLANAKHLLPLEYPADVARRIDEHVALVRLERERAIATRAAYAALIDSARVGQKTREALHARERPDDSAGRPAALDAEQSAALGALLDRVIPQARDARIDLAARIDAQLAAGEGDGWRFAELPADVAAYRAGLRTLIDEIRRRFACDVVDLAGPAFDALLAAVADGKFETAADTAAPDRLAPDQMRLWFEEVRADAVKLYLAHPDTLARIGYSGIANGGDGEPKTGFFRLGPGERESWEPVAGTGFGA